MGYAINYQECKGKEVVNNYYQTACFSKIFGSGVDKNTDRIIIYEPKLYVDEQVFLDWVSAINNAGFPCKYLGRSKDLEGYSFTQPNTNYYVIEVLTENYKYINHLVATLTLLRTSYEEGGHCGNEVFKIPNNFANIKKEIPGILDLEAIIMAHVLYGPGGHHLVHQSKNMRFFTIEEYLDAVVKVNSNDIYNRNSGQLNETWGTFATIKEPLKLDNLNKLYDQLKGNAVKTKVYVVGGDVNYANWLPNVTIVDTLDSADLVLFTGGEDVTPSYYGQKKHPLTGNNLSRDKAEKEIFEKALAKGLKMLGICRGSQFLCAMSGGILVQHQNNPKSVHPIHLYDHDDIMITSTHHQAQYPFNLKKWDYKLLGWTNNISEYHEGADRVELSPEKECEIVFYKKTKALGIQGHPEFLDFQRKYPESIAYLKALFTNFINDKL